MEATTQNTETPKVQPSTEWSAEDVVRIQLEALAANDEPWVNHGVQTAYLFCEDAGSMEMSRYFGGLTSIYHEDHFVGLLTTKCGAMVDNRGFAILSVEKVEPDADLQVVRVQVTDAAGADGGVFRFTIGPREFGVYKGALHVRQLVKESP